MVLWYTGLDRILERAAQQYFALTADSNVDSTVHRRRCKTLQKAAESCSVAAERAWRALAIMLQQNSAAQVAVVLFEYM